MHLWLLAILEGSIEDNMRSSSGLQTTDAKSGPRLSISLAIVALLWRLTGSVVK